ncbi:chromatin-remodeling protein [Martiniozyma asiatica (nom. inval.)]|nr:chromatin-remodeling protein [Martiniozyma asiatica]
MSDIAIDSGIFRRRLLHLQKSIGTSDYFKHVSGLLVVVGGNDDSNPYQKSTVLHMWLMGYEFPATAIYITKSKIVFVTSASKAKYLQPLQAGSKEVVIFTRNKDPQHNKAQFDNFFKEIENSTSAESKSVGVLSKDTFQGKFYNEWTSLWEEESKKYQLADVAGGVSFALELKDEEEQKNLRTAARASVNVMNFFFDEMSTIVDQEKNVSNSKLADKVEAKIDDIKFFKSMENNQKYIKLGKDFDLQNLDWAYKPVVQSNGKYQLKFSVESSNDKLSGPVIMSSIGLRYKSYCSNVSRTYLIQPTKEMEKNYEFLVKAQEHAFTLLRDGIMAKELFGKMVSYIESERPDLKNNFLKNMGSLIGIDFRDSQCLINAKNERVIHEGCAINLVLGFQNLKDEKQGEYGLMLADTVRVTGGEPILLTEYPKLKKEITFYFDDKQVKIKSEVKPKKEVKSERASEVKISSAANTRVLKAKMRAEAKGSEDQQAQIQKEIQKELHDKRQREGLERFDPSDAKEGNEQRSVFKRYESYIRESQIPGNVKDLKIHVDTKLQTIILPIMGRPVPFHINSYKNGSKTEEGEWTHLRLNFNSPGIMGSKKNELPYETGDDKQFIRSLTFRSKDGTRMTEVLKKITEMKKEAVKREADKKERADIVQQDRLIEVNRPRRLDNVFVRPTPDTKRYPGHVTIHQNGIRYQSMVRNDQKVDILFSNIKHLLFQSSKGELLVLIHLHLKTPIMIGKKKTYDFQLYREASDMAIDETGNRKRKYRYGDEDELEQEQEERRRRALLDREFKQFSEAISDASHGQVELDIPFRELEFQGVPSRSSVMCLPSRECLVQLVDLPFLVITLSEVEIAHLERVQFGLKNFDLVFVYKDFTRAVTQISTIPMETLEDVKAWLTDVDIPISEGPVNLNWPTIMKTINADPHQFFKDGGWSFLTGDGEDGDGEESEEPESDFDPSDEDPQDEEEYSEEDDFDESDGSASEGDEDDSAVADSDNASEEEFSD